jgi:two-component system, LuxR family, response regulator FixJ
MSLGEIFILEDDAAVREMISFVLSRAGYDPICFTDGDALLVGMQKRYPVCIVLDVRLPGKSGLEILNELRSEKYPAAVFMISGHGNIEIAVQALKMGAADFIEKPFIANDLIIRIGRAIEEGANPIEHSSNFSGRFSGCQALTKREREVLDQIMLGKTTKDISRQLGLSPRTVEDHRANIMKKADVKTTPQLLLKVFGPRQPGDTLEGDV